MSSKTPKYRVHRLHDFEDGYPRLAMFSNSDESSLIFRRFGYLQTRLILEKQDELRLLEEKLNVYDKANLLWSTTRQLPAKDLAERKKLLGNVEEVITSYAAILTSSAQLIALGRPADSEYDKWRDYLETENPIHDTELEFMKWKDDLLTLRPGREYSWLDKQIRNTLYQIEGGFHPIHRLFTSEETREKEKSSDMEFYDRERLDLCASLIVTLAILALLILPIYILYYLLSKTSNGLDQKTAGACISVLLVFTLCFSAAMSLFTTAKRHEILGAAAAYCAVLVVFFGNVPSRSGTV